MTNPLPKADVVIVGLGAAGGVAAYVLADAGLNVVGLEAGPDYSRADILSHYDEQMNGWDGKTKFAKEHPTWRPNAKSANQPAYSLGDMANMVGGTTNHYGTKSWRMRADDFKIRSTTIDKYGESSLPKGSALIDWPLTYDEIEPYYDKAEYLIGISGKAGNIQGKIVAGGNPFESPRSREYPVPPNRASGVTNMVAKGMTELGYHPFPAPSAILSQPYDGRPACTYCGYCNAGCWNDSKSSTAVTTIRKAVATGNLEVRPNSRVTKVLSNDKGDVTGVRYVDDKGVEQEQPAGAVIVSSYIYENNRLLMMSTSDYFPNGLANNGGNLGKWYMSHAYVMRNGIFDKKRLNLWGGMSGQAAAMDDLDGDNFDHTGLGFLRGASTFTNTGALPISRSQTVPPGGATWGPAYKQWLLENGDSVATCFTQLEPLPYDANFVDLDPTVKDAWGQPVLRCTFDFYDNENNGTAYLDGKLDEILRASGASTTWTAIPPKTPIGINTHAYGGTRMGDDPATSVVNKYSLAHEAPNLMVLGGSTFPSASGYNPTLTIQALALYSAEYLAKNFGKVAV